MNISRAIAIDAAETDKRVLRISKFAKRIFMSDDAISDWLKSPSPSLGGIKPIELATTEAGARAVEELVLSIAYGNVM